jgi:hypothetical protein
MSQRYIIVLLLSAVAFHAADAKDQGLSPADIAKITRTRRQAIGYPVATEQNLWLQLAPFLCNKAELTPGIVYICLCAAGAQQSWVWRSHTGH